MYDIRKGSGCGIRLTLLWPSGEKIILRNNKHLIVRLSLPNGATKPIKDTSFDEVTNTVFINLSGRLDLSETGVYGIIISVYTENAQMVSTALTKIIEVKNDAPHGYKTLVLSLGIYSVETPANVPLTGASPKIGPNGTWLVYDDLLKAYTDTGEAIHDVSLEDRLEQFEIDMNTVKLWDRAISELMTIPIDNFIENRCGCFAVPSSVVDFPNDLKGLDSVAFVITKRNTTEGVQILTGSDSGCQYTRTMKRGELTAWKPVQGDTLYYAVFDVNESGELIMQTKPGYTGANFSLDGDNLIVTI